jgi:hypothetical protein
MSTVDYGAEVGGDCTSKGAPVAVDPCRAPLLPLLQAAAIGSELRTKGEEHQAERAGGQCGHSIFYDSCYARCSAKRAIANDI